MSNLSGNYVECDFGALNSRGEPYDPPVNAPFILPEGVRILKPLVTNNGDGTYTVTHRFEAIPEGEK